ncbi:MAG: phosphoribosyltransferase family protein [Candidatus Pacebacteria bacterium]|nr:phosphoribosyltransferase family protein [Candidatus Paceibacterota bacterium]MDR3583532.1 phosphoribosyltransferase family protein [Candidatus Paceibacterota bacterium]
METRKLWEQVLFFKGLGNPGLSKSIMNELQEYLGHRPDFSHLHYGRWGDGELEDRFPNYKEIEGKTLVFFECLKEESVMLRFLQLCWAAKHQYGARQIVVVLFFMHYRRQDHEDCLDEIWRNKWLVEQMKASGISHVIMVTPHSEQTIINFQKAGIACRCANLGDLFSNRLRPLLPEPDKGKKVKVYAPDQGSISRAIELAKRLEIGVFFSLKNRGFNNETKAIEANQEKIAEIKKQFDSFADLEYATSDQVRDSTIIIVEDEIDSGGTAYIQATQLKKYGAEKIFMVFSHAVCTDPWRRKLFGADNPFTQVIVCDTVPRGEEKRTGGKMHDVSVATPIAGELMITLRDALETDDRE